MALPRRVPWSGSEEYEEVYGLLFAGSGDVQAQERAVSRIQAWQSRGCCPYAAEATASILSIILKDASSGQATTSVWLEQLRLAYAMALIRFVNGLVDPAQQGGFARSIAGIAAQIGLPLWFVELRHAATHEDLPSIKVLRDAARKAMDWLYTRYWVPQIQALSEATDTESEDISPAQKAEIARLLSKYKSIQKEAVRDASVSREKELARALQDVERWGLGLSGAHANFATSAATAAGRASESSAFAARKLAEALLEAGALVPMSKKKRVGSRDTAVPAELLAIWQPLLDFLDDTLGDFLLTLIWQSLDLLAQPTSPETSKRDKSAMQTIRAWSGHLLASAEDEVQEEALRFCLLHSTTHTASLLTTLAERHGDLAGPMQQLQALQRNKPTFTALVEDSQLEDALSKMAGRLHELECRTSTQRRHDEPANSNDGQSDRPWAILSEDRWRACPFGMLPGGVKPNLAVA